MSSTHANLDKLLRKSSSAILLVDDNRRYVDCNQAACDLLGMKREEILQLRIEDLSSSEVRDQAAEMFQAFLDDGYQAGLYILESPAGRKVNCSYSASANVFPGLHLSIMIPAEEADPELDALTSSEEEENRLSPREREVLTLLALGENNSTIAKKLFLSPETVRSHTRSARMRLGAKSRSHAIVLALQGGFLDLESKEDA